MLAAFLAAATCAATPVHLDTLPRSGTLSSIPWVQATPHRSGIVGVLFAYDQQLEDSATPTFALWAGGHSPDGKRAMKILWIVRNIHASGEIVIRGLDLGGDAAFRQSFSTVGGREYPSIVAIPHAGCWRLDVSSGGARGSLIVQAAGP